MNKIAKLFFLLIILLGCSDTLDSHQMQIKPQEPELPPKNDLWIFIMAGQSNMAGRATIEARDKIRNDRIFAINSENEVVVAREPLHFYEPSGAGLDCGISFGTEMLKHLPDNISILLVPTAVGGSSIEQWINDDTHRGIRLLSNFKRRLQTSLKHGVLKGVLWHQGESDAHHERTIQSYQGNMKILFEKFRGIAVNESLPIVAGKLGSFAVNQERWDKINNAIEAYSLSDENCSVIETSDLEDKGDKIHFNSAAQRAMGKRYAETMLGLIK
ncbi:sialate O-acetylesterase [Fulvivirgaceae bacterium BMA12]|uniref:Sialate O-acetylesterase n=1 Tax=Agaribacillus aureus TaxID=3051825 RepID=A0ABT8L605_9BACT|nr:sialate O-acetylesterase [Fulvivirgaceae bacterium BMA12]